MKKGDGSRSRGCQNEQVIRVKGMGMPRLKSTERGDMYVHITVLIPKKVTKQRELLFEKGDRGIW